MRKHVNRADELREQLLRNQKKRSNGDSKRMKSNGRKSKKKRKPSPPSNVLETKRRKKDSPTVTLITAAQKLVGKEFTLKSDGKSTRVILQNVKSETMQLELLDVETKQKLSIPCKDFGNLMLEKSRNGEQTLGKRRLSPEDSVERSPLKKRKLSSQESRPSVQTIDEVDAEVLEEEELEMSGTEEPLSSPTPSVSSPMPQNQEEHVPAIHGSRYLEDAYDFLNDVDEGAYGQVGRYKDKITGKDVALKRIKMSQSEHGFPKSSLREISCLLQLRHENIVKVKEAVISKHNDREVYMAMEFCEHDFRALMLIKQFPWSVSEIKNLMMQLISGVSFMHEHYIFHRDLKTANLLLTEDGCLKICDFGMARKFGSPIKKYTPLVVTVWYRAPEILLPEKPLYTQAVDVWSVGCIMAEFFLNNPVFKGKDEASQIEKILEFLGTPKDADWPEFQTFPSAQKLRKKYWPSYRKKLPLAGTALANSSKINLDETGLKFLLELLRWDPQKRVSAKDALKDKWFTEVHPPPAHRSMLPTFPSLSKESRKKALKKARREQELLKAELVDGFHL